MDKHSMSDLAFLTRVTVLGLVGLVGICSTVVTCVNRIEFVGQQAQIEQLRKDVLRTKTGQNEDVIGQVTQINRDLAECKRWRSIWWSRPFYSPRCEEVAFVEIPDK